MQKVGFLSPEDETRFEYL